MSERDQRRSRLRYEEVAEGFQREWLDRRQLTEEQVEQAFLHGLGAYDRFADRPFREVEPYLRESWEGMGTSAAWETVADIVRTGYERYRAAPLDEAADPGPEAADRAPRPPDSL